MVIAIVLAVLTVVSVLFHFMNPWQATPIASNWGSIDSILAITFLVCGIFFVAIMAFMVYCIVKYRHREGSKAHYEPESKKLETWLVIATSIGICAMLAPGLFVYGTFISPPEEAQRIEVMGQQWTWSFRYPGKDNVLGTTSIGHMGMDNPFGINPNDPNGQDDLLIRSNELHLAEGQPIIFLLRSIDVLHNFYIPQFRAKMDLIPGIVTSFWATPTVVGRYEILCAELCGVGHYNMRGHLIVDSEADFQAWLSSQKTFADTLTGGNEGGLIDQGRQLAQNRGCVACHSVDGSKSLGPGWQNLYGKTETLTDGSTVVVDDDYIAESILNPGAKIVQGYPPVMAPYEFSSEQLAAVIAYTKSLARGSPDDEPESLIEQGRQLAQSQGCLGCHSTDGSQSLGPGWQGLLGKTESLADGSTVVVNEAYLKESISDPGAKVVDGYPAIMTPYSLSAEQLNALIALITSLSDEQ